MEQPATVGPSGTALSRANGVARPMPRDYSISLAAKGGTDRMLLNPDDQREQPMRGFEEQYVDIVDYIVRITHRIWEEPMWGITQQRVAQGRVAEEWMVFNEFEVLQQICRD